MGGRLRYFLPEWTQMPFSDPWVLSVVREGYRIPFSSAPPLTSSPVMPPLPSLDRRGLVEKMITEFLSKGAIVQVEVDTPGFYSHLFFCRKKNGEWRPILNLKPLNKFVLVPSMKMETVQSVREHLQIGEWAASIDLKDAYLHVPIHREQWKYLRFLFDGQAFEFRVLPFGLATSPQAFTRVVKALVGQVHRLGVRMHNYLDDWLIPASSEQECQTCLDIVMDIVLRLGFIPNWEKSDLVPSQRFTFLGVVFNLVDASVRPTENRIHNFKMLAQRLVGERSTTVRTLHVLLGHMESLAGLHLRIRRFKRPLQWHLSQVWDSHNWDQVIQLGDWFVLPVRQCLADRCLTEAVPLHPLTPELVLFTDASLEGYGAHLGDQQLTGIWEDTFLNLHINLLELEAVRRACIQFRSQIRQRRILLRTDNTTVVAYINKWGGTKSEALGRNALQILELVDSWGAVLTAKHIPGSLNVLADSLSRRSPVNTEWMLAKEVALRVIQEWGSPQVDLFATRRNNQLPVFVSPVPDTLALDYDALSVDWTGLDLYAFPPPILLGRVLAKVRRQPCRMTLVAPGWTAQSWFPRLFPLLVEVPVRLPVFPGLLSQLTPKVWHKTPGVFRLHAWRLSSIPCEAEEFLERLPSWSPMSNVSQPRECTSATGTHGFVGRLGNTWIPYRQW